MLFKAPQVTQSVAQVESCYAVEVIGRPEYLWQGVRPLCGNALSLCVVLPSNESLEARGIFVIKEEAIEQE